MLARLAIISTVLIVGCTPKIFIHETKNAQDFERDRYDCQLVATQYTANMGDAGNPIIIRQEIQNCLENKHGWREQSK